MKTRGHFLVLIAAFGLATSIGILTVGTAFLIAGQLFDPPAYVHALTFVSMVASAIAFVAAVYYVSHDHFISSPQRVRWIFVIVLTNLVGGPIYVLWRWMKHVRPT